MHYGSTAEKINLELYYKRKRYKGKLQLCPELNNKIKSQAKTFNIIQNLKLASKVKMGFEPIWNKLIIRGRQLLMVFKCIFIYI